MTYDEKFNAAMVVVALWIAAVILFNVLPWLIRETMKLKKDSEQGGPPTKNSGTR